MTGANTTPLRWENTRICLSLENIILPALTGDSMVGEGIEVVAEGEAFSILLIYLGESSRLIRN